MEGLGRVGGSLWAGEGGEYAKGGGEGRGGGTWKGRGSLWARGGQLLGGPGRFGGRGWAGGGRLGYWAGRLTLPTVPPPSRIHTHTQRRINPLKDRLAACFGFEIVGNLPERHMPVSADKVRSWTYCHGSQHNTGRTAAGSRPTQHRTYRGRPTGSQHNTGRTGPRRATQHRTYRGRLTALTHNTGRTAAGSHPTQHRRTSAGSRPLNNRTYRGCSRHPLTTPDVPRPAHGPHSQHRRTATGSRTRPTQNTRSDSPLRC